MSSKCPGEDFVEPAARAGPVDDGSERVGKLDPVLGWCYLAFHRGAPSTLALVALAGLFFYLPQIAEVLRAIRDESLLTTPLEVTRVFGPPSADERHRCEVLLGTAQGDEQVGGWRGLDACRATRKAHADAAVAQLHHLARADPGTTYARGVQLTLSHLTVYDEMCQADDSGSHRRNARLCQEATAYEAPLGWFLGRQTARRMQASIRRGALLLVEEAGLR